MTKQKELQIVVEGVDLKDEDKTDLIVFNDEYNEFNYVVKCFIEICKLSYKDAFSRTLFIHNNGSGTVRTGTYSELKPMKDALVDCGLNAILARSQLN